MPNAMLGVGFVGAGPVTQAIHLPTLARLSEAFEVVHITDIDPEIAASIAARVGARSSTTIEQLLDDPAVDVVAVCSPHQFHAAQVIAACRAGAKAVLCEKPFAMSGDEASEIAAVSAETGVPILVGAMHTFDPGWQAARANWGVLATTTHSIRSSIVLPPNSRFEDFATEVITRPDWPAPDLTESEVREGLVHGGIMGLAIHDLPLVRELLSDFEDLEVLSATPLAPFGYQVVLTASGTRIELHAAMTATWRPDWVFEAYSDDQHLRVEFPPSYVHAGSAISTLSSGSTSRTFGPEAFNGYEGEWRELAAVALGQAAPPDTGVLIDDLRFALRIAEAAAQRVRETAGQVVAA
jgi:myo-inositol 2-dehydrogenase / D-chiro-inositol 1-dehydrogenase